VPALIRGNRLGKSRAFAPGEKVQKPKEDIVTRYVL